MSSANIGFEETLWKSADKLRGSMDSAEYKYVVLGLIFMKYIWLFLYELKKKGSFCCSTRLKKHTS